MWVSVSASPSPAPPSPSLSVNLEPPAGWTEAAQHNRCTNRQDAGWWWGPGGQRGGAQIMPPESARSRGVEGVPNGHASAYAAAHEWRGQAARVPSPHRGSLSPRLTFLLLPLILHALGTQPSEALVLLRQLWIALCTAQDDALPVNTRSQ